MLDCTPHSRYGFQGQEHDDEVKGKGNSVNYKYRMHDPRIGRFFAIDPLAGEYPELTPYQFSSNSPVYTVEIEGLEGGVTNILKKGVKVVTPKMVTYVNVIHDANGNVKKTITNRTSREAILRYGLKSQHNGGWIAKGKVWTPTVPTTITTHWGVTGNELYQEVSTLNNMNDPNIPYYEVSLVTSGTLPGSSTPLSSNIGPLGTGPKGGAPIAFQAKVKNASSGVDIIQTVTQSDTKFSLYKSRHLYPNTNLNKETFESGRWVNRFVDGGQHSPAGDGGTGMFYNNSTTVGRGYLGYGSAYFYDAPNAPLGFDRVQFETIISIKNYNNSILLLGSFQWGWSNKGKTSLDAAKNGIPLGTLLAPSKNAIQIIQNDYPNEKITY